MDVDQPAAFLVKDLKQRGLLKDTIVVFGGRIWSYVYSQENLQETVTVVTTMKVISLGSQRWF